MQEYLPYGGFRWIGPEELTQSKLMGIAPDAAEGVLCRVHVGLSRSVA